MKYPDKLYKGDTVGIISPSSPVSQERVLKCVTTLEKLGYKVKSAGNLSENYGGYMAGDGKMRGEWINKMFADTDIKAILCIRGGDGGNRVMEYLDKDIIANNPKIFVGYSDITSLHIFINRTCSFVTFHGPMVSSNMVDTFDSETEKSFFHAINSDESYSYKSPKGFELKKLKDGNATGELIGGNLAVMTAAIGTPYEIDADGKILFIEEVGEAMCRIDRMIFQLRNSGILSRAKGIILGQFTNCKNSVNTAFDELEILTDALESIDIPVLYNVQSGHGNPMMTIPFGAECTMDTDLLEIKFKVER